MGKKDTSFIIPDSVTEIGAGAFMGCSSLTSVTIPDSVQRIYEGAFSGCSSLINITVNKNNEYYTSIDGNLYTKDGKVLTQYAVGKKDTSFIIPNSVTKIDAGAFSGCSSITSISIPDSLHWIYVGSFSGCSSLINITVNKNNKYYTSIDGNFYTKDGKVLIQYAVGKKDTSFIIPDSVQWIYEGAFSGCSSLTDVYYTGSEEEWKKIEIDDTNNFLIYATIHYNHVQ